MKQLFKQETHAKTEHYTDFSREILFNENWKFKLEDSVENAKTNHYDDSDWQGITLPHDWSINFDFNHASKAQNEAGLLDGGSGWYRKHFTLDKALENANVKIRFAGVYMDSNLYVNGKFVGNMPNGYTPFSYDITQYLYKDGRENVIAMHVVNEQPSSRWYSGSGIYRDVHLDIVHKKHLIKEDIVINYEQENDAFIHNLASKISLVDDDLSLEITINEKDHSVSYREIFPYSEHIVFETLTPKLWSTDQPHLYIMTLNLREKGQIIDTVLIQYGYRFLDWSADEGFFLNGVNTKFHGVCLHHDNGALGARASYGAIKRKLQIMKDMGVNAIRSSHNPCDDKTLRVAEEIGLMVIDEAFDTWYWGKKQYDYGRFFELPARHPNAKPGQTWAEFDLKSMVKRGINSPAIIMWSVGNEIGESNDGSEKAIETVKKLNQWVKELDTSRYTTMGQDVYRWSATGPHENISAVVDAVGLNYAEDSFETIRKNHPDWLIYGSETSSGTRSRGHYAYPDEIRSHDNHDNRNFQQSDYGNDHVAWGKTIEQSWLFDKTRPDYAGQFFWTGFDYIGEPTPWHNQNQTPAKSSYFGIVDTAGLPKNDYYLLQSEWTKEPMIHIYPHWNWQNLDTFPLMKTQDNKIPLRVVSNQHTVELFLNGVSLGKQYYDDTKVYREWRCKFEPGTLLAIAYDETGKETCRAEIKTARDPYKLVFEKDSRSDGLLDYLIISTIDNQGNHVPIASNLIHFSIEGNARIVGVDNGNPASLERYQINANQSWSRALFSGYALVIVQKNDAQSYYKLSAQSKDLLPACYQSQAVNETEEDFTITFEVDEAALIKHHRVPYTLSVSNKGIALDLETLKYELSCDSDLVSIDESYLYCHKAGTGKLSFKFPDYKCGEEVTLTVKDSDAIRSIKTVHAYPIIVQKDEALSRLYPVKVVFDNDYAQTFSFSLLSDVDVSKNQSITVEAYIKDLDYRFQTEMIVESYLVAENFSTASLKGVPVSLPEKTHLYHSDGSSVYLDVNWNEQKDNYIEGHVMGTDLKTNMTVRETNERFDGRNLAQIWTGSELPIAFASASSKQHVKRINNGNFDAINPYTINKHHVGIVFGDAGDFSKEYIDNLTLYLTDENKPHNLIIEYFEGRLESLPKDVNQVANDHVLADDSKWHRFEIAEEIINTQQQTIRYNLKGQSCFAIRIIADELAFYQVLIHEALPQMHSDLVFSIKNGNEIISSDSLEGLSFPYLGTLDISVENNGSYYIVEYKDEIIVNIKAEGEHTGLSLSFIK